MSRSANALWALLGLAALQLAPAGCSRVPEMRGEIASLHDRIGQAERNGAMRCAPRELALARAHTHFASIELDQADMYRAEEHLAIARPNAKAAMDLSPPAWCTERGFVAEGPPPAPGDADGDGLLDPDDDCPHKPENYQGYQDEDGCPDDPDTDGDGIPDSRDGCELLAEDTDGYLDLDGCPEPDNDLDGVLDVSDECRDEPEDPDTFEDDDGCPDPDNDKDEVLDLDDHCPLEPGVKGGERPGCPKKPSLVVVTDKEIKITQQIHFEFDKARIRPISYPVLDAVVDVLVKNPKFRIEVQGHTDNVGPPAYNKRLSQRRADAVREYLVSHGIAPNRLVAVGYGLERPLVPNTNDRNRALNRRVQFVRTEKREP